jgi:hypothetical protein
MRITRVVPAAAVIAAAILAATLAAQQRADLSFDVSVAAPAYVKTHPRVVIDEAHNNFHTAEGRYKPFATLLRNDGYDVNAGTTTFTSASLKGVDVLVVSNALGPGAPVCADSSPPAFTSLKPLPWLIGCGLVRAAAHLRSHADGRGERPLAKNCVTMGKGFVQSMEAWSGWWLAQPCSRARTSCSAITRSLVAGTSASASIP